MKDFGQVDINEKGEAILAPNKDDRTPKFSKGKVRHSSSGEIPSGVHGTLLVSKDTGFATGKEFEDFIVSYLHNHWHENRVSAPSGRPNYEVHELSNGDFQVLFEMEH